MLWYVIVGIAALAAGLSGGFLWRRFRRRYRELLAAIELTQRQLTELRSAVDAQRAALDEVRTLLRHEVAPRVTRLERARSLANAARELERSVDRGTLAAGSAAALVEQLERLEAEVLAGDGD